MGKERTTVETQQQTSVQATPEEQEMNRLQLEQQRAFQPGQIQAGLSGLELLQQFMTGGELPGHFAGLAGGIQSQGDIPLESSRIGEDITSQLVSESLADITPRFQSSGILDSGVAAEISGRTAGDIRRNVAESNIERELGIRQFNIGTETSRQGFNMGNLLNLLNLATGAPAQIQQPMLAQQALLSQSLAGQRGMTGTGMQTTTSMNPFVKSFQQSLGQGLGQWGSPSGVSSAFAMSSIKYKTNIKLWN